ncbi:creatininase family protein [Gimesia sp.]|uniref:creatininase family protein n=1 Tax=Gimesia sp. TaxID=2024833 RepID=UPI003A94F667
MKIVTDQHTAFELDELKPELAFLPIGATEQHSRHLPLATDTILADHLSKSILEQLDWPGHVFLLPTLPVSSSEENTGYRGTISFTPLTMRSIVRDIWDSLTRVGIQKLIVCPWHGGNFILKPIIRELNCEKQQCHLFYLNPWEQVPASVYDQFAHGFEVHCGDVETSLMLSLCPEHVKAERVDNPTPHFKAPLQDMWSMKTLSGGEGHTGHPTQATAAKGAVFKQAVIENSVRYLQELLELSKQYPKY